MEVQELNYRLDNMSKHIDILDYDLKLTNIDIDWLVQDFDYEYDAYFKGECKDEN